MRTLATCVLYIILFGIALPFSTSMAQTADEDIICVMPLRLWMGSAAETALINDKPVPDSFHDMHISEGVCGSPLDRPSLFRWHIRYGSEDSSLAARRYFETTPPYIPKFSRSTLWRKDDSKEWVGAMEGTVSELASAISQDDRSKARRLSGGVFNQISNLHYLVRDVNNSLNMAEMFNSKTWLGHANENINMLETSLKQYDRLTLSISETYLEDALLVRQNLKMTLARSQTRAALMVTYLGKRESLKEAQTFLELAYDPAYDKFLDFIHNGQTKHCDGFSNEDLEDPDLAAFCRRSKENVGLMLAEEAFLFHELAYRTEILTDHYADENTKDQNWRHGEKSRKFLTAKTGLNAIPGWERSLTDSQRIIGITASWSVHNTLSTSSGKEVWYLKERLDELYYVIETTSVSEWPSLWKRLALQYLELNAQHEQLTLDKKDYQRPIEYDLREKLISAQLSVLDSSVGSVRKRTD